MKALYLVVASAAILSGCATNVTPQATGGSRADGTVIMSYQYGGLEKPVVDWNTSKARASARCQSWGYTSAEPFGGTNSICLYGNIYGCNRFQINITYQCTGRPEPE